MKLSPKDYGSYLIISKYFLKHSQLFMIFPEILYKPNDN